MTPRGPGVVASMVRERGYGIWPGFLDSRSVDDLRRLSVGLANGEHANHYPKSTRVWDLYRHGRPFVDLLRRDDLTTLLTELLGDHYLISDYSLNVVRPEQPVDDWHIDYPYNEMPTLVTGSLLGLQCVLALDDFDDANGGTRLVPDSHAKPCRPDGTSRTAPIAFGAPAGSLLVMAAATWHRSGLNRSTAARSAALLSFVERWVRPMTDPPEPGPWSTTDALRILFGLQRPPETINGVRI